MKNKTLSTFNKEYKVEQESKRFQFYKMMSDEGFVETVDKAKNFERNQPLFYKKIEDERFLVFNIPYYFQLKNAFFQSDFWEVFVSDEKDFLEKVLDNSKYKDIILGFRIERDIELYNEAKKQIDLKS